jgi:hypothetical protein
MTASLKFPQDIKRNSEISHISKIYGGIITMSPFVFVGGKISDLTSLSKPGLPADTDLRVRALSASGGLPARKKIIAERINLIV